MDETLQERLGRVIRSRREALHLTQEELGERSEHHRTYIGAVERGERNLSLQNIVQLARALGIPAWQLIKDAEELPE